MKTQSLSVSEIKAKLAKFCAYQDRCHWEVEQKLRELNAIPEVKEIVILELMQHGFLNEERFARSYVRGKFNQKKWGRIKIKQGLRQKQITEKLQEIALTEIDESDYENTLFELIQKKKRELKESQWEMRKKVTSYLLQKGFEYESIKACFEKMSDEFD